MRQAPVVLMAVSLAVTVPALAAETAKTVADGYDFGGVVAAMTALHKQANAERPKNLEGKNGERNEAEFDVARYFQVLKHLSPPGGWVLDYAYPYGEANGRPHLYLRKSSDPRFKTMGEYTNAVGDFRAQADAEKEVPELLKLDGTPESFFELVVFRELAGQFHLSWHANYRDTEIVTSQKDVERIIASLEQNRFGRPLNAEQKSEARKLYIAPRVRFLDDATAEVSIVTFGKWSGFVRHTHQILRQPPHRFVKSAKTDLVKYSCGIMF